MRWWECVPDRHRDEFQMQAVASGEIPCFIESQKMKTCKNGGEEGRRGKVKCTRSPHESYLHFLSTVFSYIFSPKSTHFSLALQFFFSLPLFCLILSTFNSPPHPPVLAQSSSLSLLPTSNSVPICWPCQSRLVSTPEGKWWCLYALHNITTLQREEHFCIFAQHEAYAPSNVS